MKAHRGAGRAQKIMQNLFASQPESLIVALGASRRRIIGTVIALHLAAVLFLAVSALMPGRHKPHLPAVRVQLISLPSLPGPAPAAVPAPVQTPTPTPPKSPPPTPKPRPIVTPPAPKPTPTPAPAPAPTPTPRRAWRARTPEEIRRDARLSEPARAPSRPAPAAVMPAPGQIADRIREQVRLPAAATVSVQASQPADDARAERYYDAVGVLLRQQWQQPNRNTVGRERPTATARLRVGANGTVRSARLVRSSGVPAMDASIQAVLDALERVPSFQPYGIGGTEIEFSVVFELN